MGPLLTVEFAGAAKQISDLHKILQVEREQSAQTVADLNTQVSDLTALVQRLNAALEIANRAASEAQAAPQDSTTG